MVRLHTQRAISWLTGIRGVVNIATTDACAQVWVTETSVTLKSNNIESLRLLEEELRGIPVLLDEYPWYQSYKFGEERTEAVLTEDDISSELFYLQSVLDAWEWNMLNELVEDTSACVEQVGLDVKKGESELEIGAKIARLMYEREIEPIVLLVGADERALKRRHPLPTTRCVEQYVLISVCGRRHGLVASVTRAVHFGALPDWLRRSHIISSTVNVRAMKASKNGASLGSIFSEIQRTYSEFYEGDEWKKHHQGGLTGYAPRTRLATPLDNTVLYEGMAVAWNPTIAGAKSEAIGLVGVDQGYAIGMSQEKNWPTLKIEIDGCKANRPDILTRQVMFSMGGWM